jgi:osmotically-inducible protein OsmY
MRRRSAAPSALRKCVPGVEARAIDMGDASVGSSQHNDEEIAHSIESALKWHTYATNDAVTIVVQGGQATLSGELEWDWQSHGVVSTVRLLPGVVDVRDQIVVKSKGFKNAGKPDLDV